MRDDAATRGQKHTMRERALVLRSTPFVATRPSRLKRVVRLSELTRDRQLAESSAFGADWPLDALSVPETWSDRSGWTHRAVGLDLSTIWR
jgi:hypothetical protein